ncbi:LOW QUALITY PROTEIN: poly [ADP-ribose] polymerase 1-like [Ostrinia furnacalis]|uniref:LOW QUALITY PROTEIN: poly [ADP-ribose] polymerase 1-like n=1 Tax=Ostrinia furnacalis TaxID=93504 RepID=UPI00103D3584|nr:LOW QUALITY PROTEIN: poly [ADP-ribose] polymerase 1-like [Ostrinia furnacalis]
MDLSGTSTKAEIEQGIKRLSQKDYTITATEEPSPKKLKDESYNEEQTIYEQNGVLSKYRDELSQLEKVILRDILKRNGQNVSKSEMLDHLADCLAFGAFELCPECKGQLVFGDYVYKCKGDYDEWSKCPYKTKIPKRRPMIVPSEYEHYPIFTNYKPCVDTRVLLTAPEVFSIKEEIHPLKDLQFFLFGNLKTPKETLEDRISKMGGHIVSTLTNTVAAVVSTKEAVEEMSDDMKEVRLQDIEVIDESFFDLIDPKTGTVSETLQSIKQNKIAPWGSDPVTRVLPEPDINGENSSQVAKVRLQGGSVVDPDFELAGFAQIYKDEDDTAYTVVLAKTDVVAGKTKNSFYKLQILECNTENREQEKEYYLYRAWGRIGTDQKETKYDSKPIDVALMEFKEIFKKKTKNLWDERKKFKKHPNFYSVVKTDHKTEKIDGVIPTQDEISSLPEPVQQLVLMIFDINTMKNVCLEYELDLEKMPLGKLSKDQIKSGYEVLSKLNEYVEQGGINQTKVLAATNRFFTLIPHNCGSNNPPLLDNLELIKKKMEMLDNLLEIQVAYSLVHTKESSESQIDVHYRRLNADIGPIDRASPEFEMIATYVANTHASTHHMKLEIQHVFEVFRTAEDERYEKFKNLHNRRLLWHGSRIFNYAGILSQGLRIAPSEAPVTGWMFGKGIYFADMVTKSANYCHPDSATPIVLLMLCEVALGNMKECTAAEYVDRLPKGFHSVWGRGRFEPDPAQARTLPDTTMVPLGRPIRREITTDLLYNEFIVYDVAQVNMKYLVQVKAHFE